MGSYSSYLFIILFILFIQSSLQLDCKSAKSCTDCLYSQWLVNSYNRSESVSCSWCEQTSECFEITNSTESYCSSDKLIEELPKCPALQCSVRDAIYWNPFICRQDHLIAVIMIGVSTISSILTIYLWYKLQSEYRRVQIQQSSPDIARSLQKIEHYYVYSSTTLGVFSLILPFGIASLLFSVYHEQTILIVLSSLTLIPTLMTCRLFYKVYFGSYKVKFSRAKPFRAFWANESLSNENLLDDDDDETGRFSHSPDIDALSYAHQLRKELRDDSEHVLWVQQHRHISESYYFIVFSCVLFLAISYFVITLTSFLIYEDPISRYELAVTIGFIIGIVPVIYPFVQKVNYVVTNKRVFKLLPMIFGVRIKILSMVNKPMRVAVGKDHGIVVSEESSITNTQWPGISYSVHFEYVKNSIAFKKAFTAGLGFEEQESNVAKYKRSWSVLLLGFVLGALILSLSIYATVVEKYTWIALLGATICTLVMIMYFSSLLFWWKSREANDVITLKNKQAI